MRNVLHSTYCKILKKAAVLAFTLLAMGSIYANPMGGDVASGSATISNQGNTTTIQQSSDKAIINWQSFNIGAGEKTHFQQPSASSITLNRINPDQGASQIYGQLSSNGRIILVNQAGIYFGPSARVDVGGLIASTANITDEKFLAGKYKFDQPSMYHGTIINQGTIIAANNGLVALVGANVSNEGHIHANSGKIILASGSKFTIDLAGDGLINFAVDEAASGRGNDQNGNQMRDAVSNSGTLVANGGEIILSAKTASGVVDRAINMSGVAQAKAVYEEGGKIIFAAEGGAVSVSGKIIASGKDPGQKGGKIKILGNSVDVKASAEIDVSGYAGGGEILIGGNYQGKGPEINALNTFIEKGADINANALMNGNGGRVIVWADNYTGFHGTISAQGGAFSGNGGFVETSGHYLNIAGASVSTLAPAGKTGTWLLDPSDLTICTACTTTATVGSNTYSNNASNSNLFVGDLTTALASNNITVQTTNTGSGGNGDIFVNTAINWSTATTLTLSAYRNITSAANISNTGGGSVVLRADNTGTGTGTVLFTSGNVTLSGGSGTATVYYNPTTFGTQDTIYTGGTTPTQYMLINVLGNSNDTATTASLGALSNNSSLWGGNFALGRDIDASGTSTWNSSSGINAIGNSTTNFTGKFDGQYYTVSNLFKSTANLQGTASGFFGVLGSGGTIQKLYLKNLSFSAPQFNIVFFGGLVGTINGGTVSNVGVINPTLSSISNFNKMGGLVGSITSGTLSSSYVLGGLISENNISGTNPTIITVGGAVGENAGTLQNVYSTASVVGYRIAGGLVGMNVGGTISSSFSAGPVSLTSTTLSLGGLVGSNSGTVTNSYWDSQTSGLATSSGGTSKTTAELQQALQTGFSGSTWGIIAGNGLAANGSYPYLLSFNSSTPRVISGFAPGGSASATGLGGTTVKLAYSGANIDTAYTSVNGFYYFLENNGVVANSNPFLVYLNSGSTKSNIIGLAPSSDASVVLLNMTANTIGLYGDSSTALTNTNLGTAKGGLSSTDILYSLSSANLTLGNATNTTAHLTALTASRNNAGTISTTTTSYNADGTIGTTSGGTTSVNFGGALTTNGSITTSGTQTYSGAVTLGFATSFVGSALTFNSTIDNGGNLLTFDNSSTSSVAGGISGSGGLTKLGSGILTLAGAGSYSGATTLSVGTLRFGVNSAIGSASAVSISSGATLDLNNFSGSIGSLSGDGALTLGTGTLTTGGNNASTTYSGLITGSSGGLTKTGSGTFTLNNDSNSYSGTTTVNQGVLLINTTNSLPSTSTLSIANGASATLNGFSGAGYFIVNNGTLTIQNNSSSSYSGVLSGNGDLVKTGSGALTLSGANSYNGTTSINEGTVIVSNATGLGSTVGGTLLASGTELDILGVNIGAESITLNGATLKGLGTSSLSGNITLGAASTLTTDSSSDVFTLSGTINGASALTLAGSGRIILAGIIGGSAPLSSLIVNSAVTLSNNITTSGNQTYNNAITLDGNVNLSGADILLNSITGNGNNLSVTGSGASSLTLASGTPSWSINSANGGSISDVIGSGAFTFNNIANLIGGAGSDTFTLNGGSLTGSINGEGGNNTIVASNGNYTFNINGANSGSATNLGGFNNIQNITGGSGITTVYFNNNGSMSGTLNGVNTNSALYYTNYATPVRINMTDTYSGTATINNNQTPIASYVNFGTVWGASTIQTTSKASSVYITGAGAGYINDPFYFNNVTNIIGSSNTQVIFNTSAQVNTSTGTAVVDGQTMTFENVPASAYSGSIVQSNSSATTAAIDSSMAQMTQTEYTTSNTSTNPGTTTSSSDTDSSSTGSSEVILNTASAVTVDQTLSTTLKNENQTDSQIRSEQKAGSCQ
jgi:filamentous hemagglutinin family protein